MVAVRKKGVRALNLWYWDISYVTTNFLFRFQVDKLGYKEQQVSLLIKLGRVEEAEKIYRDLLSMIPDNYRWINRLNHCSWNYECLGICPRSSTILICRQFDKIVCCLYQKNGSCLSFLFKLYWSISFWLSAPSVVCFSAVQEWEL